MALLPLPDRPRLRAGSGRAGVLALAVVVVLLGVALLIWRGSPGRTIAAPSGATLGHLPRGLAPNDLSLLVITLDTTRADRLASYGFGEIETPHLDRLAREGVLFEQAESAAPLTLPAHSSIFTGQFPPAHGVRDNGGFYLAEERVLLAEVLRDQGLRTGGFIGAFVLDSKWGIAQGFNTYFDDFELEKTASLSIGEIQRPASEVTDAALAWLDEAPEERFFAWLHFYDPHSPYEPPEPFASRYRDRPYVGEIAYVDSQVGRLLEWLDSSGRMRDTVVMVIGDHGESLGEHGESGHGFFIYEGATRVPFIIRAPYDSMRGRRIETPVRAVDLGPTALDLLGIGGLEGLETGGTGGATSGTSLAGLLAGEVSSMRLPAYSEAIYPRYHFGWSDLAALRIGDMKYIDAPIPELYDLSTDPEEMVDLAGERGDEVARLKASLAEMEALWREAAASADATEERTEELDPDTRARLAALGYATGFVDTATEAVDRSSLADPKEKIHLYNLLRQAREASLREGGSAVAIEALERLLAEDPSVIDAWVRLGNEKLRIEDVDGAIVSYQKALELKPDYELAVINLAKAYRRAGLLEEAMVGYRQYLRLDPRNAQVHFELGRMLTEHNQLDEADEHLRQALESAPEMAAAQVALGLIALRRSDVAGAEELIRAALVTKPDVRMAHFNLALLAEERGDGSEAVRLYRQELELYPESFKAEFNLGRVFGAMGDRDGEAAAYERSIEINPEFAEGHFFLAKTLLDLNRRLDRAIELARRGLELSPASQLAPMGHFLLADIYSRLGRIPEAEMELAAARALQGTG